MGSPPWEAKVPSFLQAENEGSDQTVENVQTDLNLCCTVKPVLSDGFKRRPKIGFQDQLLLNAGQRSWSILQYFRPPLSYYLSFKTCVLSIFEWPLKTGLLYAIANFYLTLDTG